jgi:hypothetical protein
MPVQLMAITSCEVQSPLPFEPSAVSMMYHPQNYDQNPYLTRFTLVHTTRSTARRMVKYFTGWYAPTSSSIDLRPSTRWSQVTVTVGPTAFHASRALSQNSILDIHDKFQRITKIEFHTVTPSRITYENTNIAPSSAKEVLPCLGGTRPQLLI